MKLSKPPINEEQSILEDYVDFLLLDKSNVHTLKSAKSTAAKTLDSIQLSKVNTGEKSNAFCKPQQSSNKPTQTPVLIANSNKKTITKPELTSESTAKVQQKVLPQKNKDPRLNNVEKLLAQIAVKRQPQTEADHAPLQVNKLEDKNETDLEISSQVELQASLAPRECQPLRNTLPETFQTLIFKVNQLPLAVPLVKLGGIVKVTQSEITPLVGTPDWFMGLVIHNESSLMVVDTQKFLTPEQAPNEPKKDYRFLIVLDNSNWALACHSVEEANKLTQEDIRWSQKNSKRPWFAGMLVEKMSALLEVDGLINLLADTLVD